MGASSSAARRFRTPARFWAACFHPVKYSAIFQPPDMVRCRLYATSIVFSPAAPLFLFMHGKDITIPKGHEATCYVNADFKIDPAKFAAATTPRSAALASAPKPSGKALTNQDVITLKSVGFTDDLLIAKIKAVPAAYKIETDNLVALKKGGVSDAVISAMIDATRR
jgi:hypothetical protein